MKLLKRADLILILLLLLAAAALLLPGALFNGQVRAQIYADGLLYQELPLQKSKAAYTLSPPGQPELEIRVDGDSIAFVRASCPDKLCIHSGALTRPGQTAVCLPAKIAIVLRGTSRAAENGAVDAYTY